MTSRGRVLHAWGVEEATHGHRMMLGDPEIRPHVGDQLGLIDRTLTPDRIGLDVVVEKLVGIQVIGGKDQKHGAADQPDRKAARL